MFWAARALQWRRQRVSESKDLGNLAIVAVMGIDVCNYVMKEESLVRAIH